MTVNARMYDDIFEMVNDTLHPDYLEVLKIMGVSQDTPCNEKHGRVVPCGKQYMVEEVNTMQFYNTVKPVGVPETITKANDTYKFVCMAQEYNHAGYIGEAFPVYVNVDSPMTIWILYETYIVGEYEGEPERMTYVFNSVHPDLYYAEQKIAEIEQEKL